MAKLTAAHLLARTLKKYGATRVFTLCGNEINVLLLACVDEGLTLCGTRHEAAAAHMADAWGRYTCTPGVSIVSKGAGHTNSITGIATAWMACSPMLAISGGASTSQSDRRAPHELAQADMVERVTKWSRTVHDAARVPEYVSRALRIASSGTPGPVHLSIPGDVLASVVDEDLVPIPEPMAPPRPGAPAGAAEQVARLLAQAERPLIIAGSGVHFGAAAAALARFIERTGIPCLTLAMGRGALSDEHPACLGSGDVRLSPLARQACRSADCVLVIGESFDFRLAFGRALSPQAKIVQVHADAAELGRNLHPSLAIVAHAAEWLTALAEADAVGRCGAGKHGAWLAELREAQSRAAAARGQELSKWTGPGLHPGSIADAVTAACGPEPFCAVLDMGDFAAWCASLPAREAGTIVGPIGTVGAAIPMGIAAKLARPDRKVVVLIGDGGFGMHGFELHTAIRLGLPLVVLVGNDGGWGMERQLQSAQYGRTAGVDLGELRHDRVVEAMGGVGIRVEQAAELAPALARAFHCGAVACVDVRIGSVASAITQGLLARR